MDFVAAWFDSIARVNSLLSPMRKEYIFPTTAVGCAADHGLDLIMSKFWGGTMMGRHYDEESFLHTVRSACERKGAHVQLRRRG